MWKRVGLIASCASLMAFAVGCGGEDGGAVCTTNDDCGTDEICHPDADVCVKTCTGGVDCPSEAKTCAAIGGGNTQMICQCSTDQLCQSALGDNVVCSTQYKICMTKCASDSDCPSGDSCNTSTGQCGGGTPTSCNSSNPQPDVCSYGQFCSGSSCTAVAAPTCSNFVGSSHGTSWNAATSTGPVIYEITLQDFAENIAFCGAGNPKRARFNVKAYRTTGSFSTTASTFEGELHYVRTDGSEGPVTNTTQNITVTNSGKHVTWTQNLCAQSSVTSFTAGFHFQGGNEVCVTAQ